MAVRDDRSDVKQTTTGFRGPLMVQSLTSAKSKFLSLFGDDEPEMWHKKCWKNAGKPEYSGGSDYSSDQGYFYDDPTEDEWEAALEATE